MSKKCSQCGENISNDAKFCKNCGQKVIEEGTVKEETTTVSTIEPTNNTQKVPVNGLSITGFVLSLVALMCCGVTSPLGLIFSIIGLVKGNPEDGTGKGLAIAGIIISGIMLILFIISIIMFNGISNVIEEVINDPNFTTEWNNIVTGFIH